MDTSCTLANLGNTCFINACLQIMAHIPQLGRLGDTYKKHAKHTTVESMIFKEWLVLQEQMHSPPLRVIHPLPFVKAVHDIARKKQRELFTGWAQNDMPEFLLFIIECMHQSIARPLQLTISGEPRTPKDKLAISCYTMLQKVYEKEYSEIISLLYGISLTTITDTDEPRNTLSSTPEPFFMIDLPVYGQTLFDCLDKYTELELMHGENAWYNEKTRKYQNVYKHVQFWSLPDIVIFVLNRYTSHQHKLNTLITFPVDQLDMSRYIQGYDETTYVYELFGVCNHMGNMMGGHYTAYVKSLSGAWLHYNDAFVEKVRDPTHMIKSTAYCLFYRKKCM